MQEISQTVKCLNKHNEVIHNTNHPSKSKPISSWTEQKSLQHDNSYLISLLLRNKAYMHQASANFDRFDLRVANSKKKLNWTRLAWPPPAAVAVGSASAVAMVRSYVVSAQQQRCCRFRRRRHCCFTSICIDWIQFTGITVMANCLHFFVKESFSCRNDFVLAGKSSSKY